MQHMKRYETDDLSVTTTTNHYRKRKKMKWIDSFDELSIHFNIIGASSASAYIP